MSGILGGLLGSFAPAASEAFDSIATAAGNGSSTTITFSSIPSTYVALQIRGIARTADTETNTSRYIFAQFNGDTGSNYAWHGLYGNGSSVTSEAMLTAPTTSAYMRGLSQATDTNNMSVYVIDVHDYKSTTRNKTIRAFSGVDFATGSSGTIALYSGLWMNTSAITSISLTSNTGPFSSNTVFALYGIKGA